jgi:hypothetical protein
MRSCLAARAVHPELVKWIVVSDTATGQSVIQNMGATALINGARHGYGKSTPKDRILNVLWERKPGQPD